MHVRAVRANFRKIGIIGVSVQPRTANRKLPYGPGATLAGLALRDLAGIWDRSLKDLHCKPLDTVIHRLRARKLGNEVQWDINTPSRHKPCMNTGNL